MIKVHSTRFCVTPAIKSLMDLGINFGPFVHKHLNGDWGDISEPERARNIESLEKGNGHVLSVHHVTPDITIWITTRAGVTLIMLPLA